VTVRDLIKGSLRLIGVIAGNETPSSDMQTDALASLNEMLDSWSADGVLQYATTREEFALTVSQQQRTIGATGNFVTTRPTQIVAAGVELNGIEIPIELINVDQWASITNKDSTSNIPQKMYIEGTFPNETLNFWPIPNTANNLVLYSLKPFSTLTVATSLSFPPGYQEAIRYNLAKKLAPEYGRPLDAAIEVVANDSLALLKTKNTKALYMTSDAFGLAQATGSFDINTGE